MGIVSVWDNDKCQRGTVMMAVQGELDATKLYAEKRLE